MAPSPAGPSTPDREAPQAKVQTPVRDRQQMEALLKQSRDLTLNTPFKSTAGAGEVGLLRDVVSPYLDKLYTRVDGASDEEVQNVALAMYCHVVGLLQARGLPDPVSYHAAMQVQVMDRLPDHVQPDAVLDTAETIARYMQRHFPDDPIAASTLVDLVMNMVSAIEAARPAHLKGARRKKNKGGSDKDYPSEPNDEESDESQRSEVASDRGSEGGEDSGIEELFPTTPPLSPRDMQASLEQKANEALDAVNANMAVDEVGHDVTWLTAQRNEIYLLISTSSFIDTNTNKRVRVNPAQAVDATRLIMAMMSSRAYTQIRGVVQAVHKDRIDLDIPERAQHLARIYSGCPPLSLVHTSFARMGRSLKLNEKQPYFGVANHAVGVIQLIRAVNRVIAECADRHSASSKTILRDTVNRPYRRPQNHAREFVYQWLAEGYDCRPEDITARLNAGRVYEAIHDMSPGLLFFLDADAIRAIETLGTGRALFALDVFSRSEAWTVFRPIVAHVATHFWPVWSQRLLYIDELLRSNDTRVRSLVPEFPDALRAWLSTHNRPTWMELSNALEEIYRPAE